MKYFRRVVSGAKEDAEKVFRPDFCALRGSDSGGGGGGRCPSLASKEGTSIFVIVMLRCDG